jgi:hypothetical protein
MVATYCTQMSILNTLLLEKHRESKLKVCLVRPSLEAVGDV